MHRSRLKRAAVGLIVILVWLAGGAYFVFTVGEGLASGGWPAVEGRLLASEIDHRWRKNGSDYVLEIRYEYAVAGRSFRGDRLDALGEARYRTRAEADAARRRLGRSGDPITVFYDPSAPTRSVLRPGLDWTRAVPPAVILLVIPLGGIWRALRQRRADWASAAQPAAVRRPPVMAVDAV